MLHLDHTVDKLVNSNHAYYDIKGLKCFSFKNLIPFQIKLTTISTTSQINVLRHVKSLYMHTELLNSVI